MEETTTAMSAILATATELLTWCLTSMGSIISTITSNPILLVGFLITFVSFAFGLVFRTAGQR